MGSEAANLLLVIGVAVTITGSIVLFIYLKFGRGLAFKIFGVVQPTVTAGALVAYMSAREMFAGGVSVIVIIGISAFGIGAQVFLYRIVVKALDRQVAMLNNSATLLSTTAKETAETASQQSAMVQQVTNTVEEIHQQSALSAKTSMEVVDAASKAVSQGREGRQTLVEAIRIVDEIGQVAEVVTAVGELADQSNLLALNASIEAAKAGEQGRGFSVVASEVRSLADQSRAATRRIHASIQNTEKARGSLFAVERVVNQLALVLDSTVDMARQIAIASQGQVSGIEQIAAVMTSASEGGMITATTACELEEAVNVLNEQGQQLRRFVTG